MPRHTYRPFKQRLNFHSGVARRKAKSMITDPARDPISAIVSWLDAQPPEVKDTIAILVMMRLPEFELFSHHLNILPELYKWLQEDERDRLLVTTGKAVIFRALVNFTCRRHFSKEGWDEMTGDNAWIKDQVAGEGQEDVANMAATLLQGVPFRKALWLKAARSWEQLCANDLSDEALARFQHAV